VEGRLNKIRSQKALLEQPFIKDTGNSVAEHIKAAVANLGENIQVRFCWRMSYVCMYLCALSCYMEHACLRHQKNNETQKPSCCALPFDDSLVL